MIRSFCAIFRSLSVFASNLTLFEIRFSLCTYDGTRSLFMRSRTRARAKLITPVTTVGVSSDTTIHNVVQVTMNNWFRIAQKWKSKLPPIQHVHSNYRWITLKKRNRIFQRQNRAARTPWIRPVGHVGRTNTVRTRPFLNSLTIVTFRVKKHSEILLRITRSIRIRFCRA